MARKPTTLHTIINELVDRSNTDTRRIRYLEQREKAVSARMNSIEKEILNLNRTFQKMLNDTNMGLKKRDQTISGMQNTIKEIIKHLKGVASNSKINELEAMIDIYSPLKSNFATRDEVERMISERLSKMPKNNK